MNSSFKNHSTLLCNRKLLCIACIALLGACAGAPKNSDALDQANASYASANQDVLVAKHAALELDNAKRELDRANRVWKAGEKQTVVDHHAYLASKRIEIATHRAEQIESENQIELMKVERQKVQIDARVEEANRAKREAEALQKQMADLQAEQTERGLVMTLGDVLFQIGAAQLAPGAAIEISKIANFMRQYPQKTAMVEGHSDSMGNTDNNFDLSVRRASAVRLALIEQGVEAHRLTTNGFGEARPIATNDTSSGRRQNRRVEIVFSKSTKTVTASGE